MFQTLKDNLEIVSVAEDLFEVSFSAAGDKTFEAEDKECPFCGHKDCFKIKDDGPDSIFKCFSCDKGGDVITMVSEYKKISVADAGKWLANKYDVKLPSDYSPVQEVFNLAAQYYATCLKEAKASAILGGKSPLDYQLQQRKHSEKTIDAMEVGWSDGKLIEYLDTIGIDSKVVQESGLMNSKKNGDFLPSNTFIYPHKIKGRVSHFTFKDPSKRLAYQIPNKNKLNGHSFYNSDSIYQKKEMPVIVVEGENDLLSILDSDWSGAVICCNGSIATSQLEWMSVNLLKRDVITIFDVDPAGDKYRDKVNKIKHNFNSLLQVTLTSGVKDIDEFLKNGGSLRAALDTAAKAKEAEGEEEVEVESGDSKIVERNGCYFKAKQGKEGSGEFYVRLSNFTLKLRNIYIREREREREVVIIRDDGVTSSPVKVNSDAKVSLKPFKTLVSNAVDASFYGKEEDLTEIWEYVYKTCKERIVHLPPSVGKIPDFGGWIFSNSFVSETGAVYKPDEEGIIWIANHTSGVKPMSLNSSAREQSLTVGVPTLVSSNTDEEVDELLRGFLENLSSNLASVGDAIIMTAWAWASVYSDVSVKKHGCFPFLFLRGSTGQGKSTIIKWLLSLFDMDESGYSTFPQINSGVSFVRKLAYYSNLPMALDEIRIGKDASNWQSTFRAWYNRSGRTTGAREGGGVNEWPVRSSLIFGGEDLFADPATNNRCIHIRIKRADQGRETDKSYKWISNRKKSLSSVGFKWVRDAHLIPESEFLKEFEELEALLKKSNISDRITANWAVVGIFAKRLSEKFFPQFDFLSHMLELAKEDVETQTESSTLSEFWQTIEGMQSEDRPRVTGDHIRRDGQELYVWFTELFRLFEREISWTDRERFSKRAILESLKETSYYIRDDRKQMGLHGTSRRIIVLNVDELPETVQNITEFLD